MSLDEIRIKFAKATSGHLTSVFKTSLTKPIAEGGLPEAFDWLLFALEHSSAASIQRLAASKIIPAPTPSDVRYEKLDTWLNRAETDSSPEEFLSQFHGIKLPAWDHYTHIRIAFLILTTHGRQKG